MKKDKSLQVTEPFFRQILDSIEDYAVFTTDKKGIISSWNAGAEHLFGYTEEEILGKNASLLFIPEDRKKRGPEKELKTSIKEGRAKDEKWHLRRDGSRFWASGLVFPLKDEQGKLQGFTKIARDLTERKEAQEKHSTVVNQVIDVLESMGDAFFMLDQDFTIIRVNRIQEKVSHTKRKDTIGKNFWEVFPAIANTMSQYWIEYHKVMETREPSHFIEYYEPLDLYTEVDAYPTQDGGISVFFRDITKKKKAEENVIAANNQLQLITDAIPAFISYVNNKEQYTFVNSTYEKWFDLSKKQVQGKTVKQILGKEAYKKSKHVIKEVLTGVNVSFENTLKKNEDERHFQVQYIPDKATDGTVKGFVVLSHDTTDEKLFKEALIESEKQFRSMADNAPVMIWITDPSGECIYLNKQWYDYTGQTEMTGLGFGWLDAVHPSDSKSSGDIFLNANKKQISFSLEYRLKGKDGIYRWYIDAALPKFDKNGKFEGYIGSVIDINERKLAEEALIKSKERQDIMLQASKLGLWYCNLPFYELIWDNKVKEHFWLSEDAKVTIKIFYAQMHPDDRLPTKEAIAYSIANHTPYDIECRTINKVDGKMKWIRALGRTFYDKTNKPIRFDGVTIDITDRKQLERQKDDFLGIASHELKTPVTSIKAYAQALEAMFIRKGDTRSADKLRKMDSQIDKLNNLIGDLLDVTKMQSGKLQFHEMNFDFNTLVNEVIEEIQRTTETHTITNKLTKEISIYGDRERIGQVMTNLITNAIKYSPNADEIIVTSALQKNSIMLCVEDFGVGIPKEKQDKVFEQFFRVSGPKQDTFPGLGLGLYISSEIVKREGGRIWVESVEGKGSTFCFSLPIKKG